jgi:pimeloyl-ACP methyl ester carboxylesterase
MFASSSLPFWQQRGTQKPVEYTFRTGKHKIIYEKVGEGPSLLLVHGLSGSGRWWKNNLPVLSKSFTCHVLELVGYGANRAFRPLPLVGAAEALASFIATELPTGKTHVIGHSMGGHICSYLAAQYPERVDKLVLAAASGMVRSDLVRMAMRLPVAGHYSPLDFLPTLAVDALRAGPLNLFLSTLDILGSDTTEIVKKITAPTLLVFGDRDNLIPPAAGEAMHLLISGSQLEIIEGAGHVLMWDHPKTFNRLVMEFLKREIAPAEEAVIGS